MEQCVALARAVGVDLKTMVFPRNKVGHLGLVRDAGLEVVDAEHGRDAAEAAERLVVRVVPAELVHPPGPDEGPGPGGAQLLHLRDAGLQLAGLGGPGHDAGLDLAEPGILAARGRGGRRPRVAGTQKRASSHCLRQS